MRLFDGGEGRQGRGQDLSDEMRQEAGLVGELDNQHKRREDRGRRNERDLAEHAKQTARGRGPCLQAHDDPIGKPPLVEQRADLGHTEIAFLAHALAHDVEQNRPLALHQDPVVPASVIPGAFEIRVHVGLDFRRRQAALGSPAGIRPVLAEGGEMRDFRLVDVGGRIENARTDAMLVQRTIA